MERRGTREWSNHSKNILKYCSNGCLYCYETERQLRLKLIKRRGDRQIPTENHRAYREKPKKLKGRIMFPTTHDLPMAYYHHITGYLKRWLEIGNKFLIVTKPDIRVIQHLCSDLEDFKEQILFRFTIGSKDDSILKFWEPNAPLFMERWDSLHLAKREGFRTSVSCEPYLDDNIINLVNLVYNEVTDTIWIGKMNQIKRRVINSNPDIDWTRGAPKMYLDLVLENQTDGAIRLLYHQLEDYPKIRWKDSIRKVLGLPEIEEIE